MFGLGLPAAMGFLITALVLFGPNAIPFLGKSRSGATVDLAKGREKRDPA
ncbi:MAG: translocase [Thermodesulfovibrionales bacterium]|jgi:hypothetical protein